jgi:hypothetical protein
VSEVPASYSADFSEVEAERARRVERIQRALAVCERAFADQFGQPLEGETVTSVTFSDGLSRSR